MPWMGEAAYCAPQMDDPGPGERRMRKPKPRAFKTLAMIQKEARQEDELRKMKGGGAMNRIYEFTFKGVGTGRTEQEALSDCIDAMLQQDIGEPISSELLHEGESCRKTTAKNTKSKAATVL